MRTKAYWKWWEIGVIHNSHLKTQRKSVTLLLGSSKMIQTVILPLGWIPSGRKRRKKPQKTKTNRTNSNMGNTRYNTERDWEIPKNIPWVYIRTKSYSVAVREGFLDRYPTREIFFLIFLFLKILFLKILKIFLFLRETEKKGEQGRGRQRERERERERETETIKQAPWCQCGARLRAWSHDPGIMKSNFREVIFTWRKQKRGGRDFIKKDRLLHGFHRLLVKEKYKS